MNDNFLIRQKDNGSADCHVNDVESPIFTSNLEIIKIWKKRSDNNYFLAKDNFWTIDLPTTASSLFLEGFYTGKDATVIKLLKENGYCLLGKSVLDEFACGGTGLFSSSGPIYNPNSKENIAGGSSSGSAFAVAKEIVPFALGHDAGDSIRRPAAYCGIIGFKPSYGLVSRYGVIPMSSSFDTVGIMSKHTETIKNVFKIINQSDYNDLLTVESSIITIKRKNKKRIAILKGIEKFLESSYRIIYEKAIISLREGTDYFIQDIEIPSDILNNLQITYLIICSSELVSHLGALQGITYGSANLKNESIIKRRTSLIGKWVKERILFGTYFLENGELVEKAKKLRATVKNWSDNLLKEFDFFIFPGTNKQAPFVNGFPNEYNTNISHWSDNLMLIANLTGNPSINIPIGLVNGLPISLNIDSYWKNDESLIDFAEFVLKKIKEY